MQIAEDKIIIELKQGKKTGYALVFLDSGSEVTKAQQLLHKRTIGGRYIDVQYPQVAVPKYGMHSLAGVGSTPKFCFNAN